MNGKGHNCETCKRHWSENCGCPDVSAVHLSDGLEGQLFSKHNDNLVWLILLLAYLKTTQTPIDDDRHERAQEILNKLREDLHSIRDD